ncbi:hypothetical protein D3C73_1011040 [compost metagenome]
MSLGTASVSRIPASNPSDTISPNLPSLTISRCTCGYMCRNRASTGCSTNRIAPSLALILTVPRGTPRSSSTARIASSIDAIAGRSFPARRSPASVRDTLRVVRLNRRAFNRCSRALIVWLIAEGVMFSSAAAARKLRCPATARNALSAVRSTPPDC